MPKYKISWDAGFGESTQIVDADDQEHADLIAHDAWRDEAEANADYSATLVGEDEEDEDQ